MFQLLTAQTKKPTVFIGIGAVALFLLGLAPIAPVPTPAFAPLSEITILPALLASGFGGDRFIPIGAAIGALIAPVAFVFTARSIAKSGNLLPKVFIVVFSLIFILSCALAIMGWKSTVLYTSMSRLVALLIQSIVPPIFIVIYSVSQRSRMTFPRSIMIHWLAFAWISWSALPWYGELL